MKPRRIILVRHGESEGNIDKNIYMSKPDYALILTPKGIEQALETGQNIKNLIQWENYGIYYSPFFRARQTMEIAYEERLGTAFCQFKKEEPRLREQEWSNGLRKEDITIQKLIEHERDYYGHFYYRFYGGESCADVYDRISDFIGTLNRDFEKENFPKNVLIFGHGMANRLFLMRWFHKTVEEFETWANPQNGEFYVLELQENRKYVLTTEVKTHKILHKYQYNFNGNDANS